MKALMEIERRLKVGCRIKVESAESYNAGQWTACIFTERNDYPHWIQFTGGTPQAAIRKLQGYLAGTVPDHARNPRDPHAFLMDEDANRKTRKEQRP